MQKLFGDPASPFDDIVERVTSEKNTSENWGLIIEITDKVSTGGQKAAKDCLLAIKKRLNHRNPHVVMLALTVLDSCMSNCGTEFRHEVCTRDFMSELKSKATQANAHQIEDKTRTMVFKWSQEKEIMSDPSLQLISQLVKEMQADGYEFETPQPKNQSEPKNLGPDYVSSKEEAEQIAKAIEESLKIQGAAPKKQQNRSENNSASESQYSASSFNSNSVGKSSNTRVVKAMYDFEAAEENELTFRAGEIITVLDDGDPNWWRGANHRGEGLFPASFVTGDLAAEIVDENSSVNSSKKSSSKNKKSVQFDENVSVQNLPSTQNQPPAINEDSIVKCLTLLGDADPTGTTGDSEELTQLEASCQQMLPLIDAKLASIDRNSGLLAEVDVKLRDALALYDSAVQEAGKLLAHSQFMAQQQAYSSQQQNWAAQQQTAAYGYTNAGAMGQGQAPAMSSAPQSQPQVSSAVQPQNQQYMGQVQYSQAAVQGYGTQNQMGYGSAVSIATQQQYGQFTQSGPHANQPQTQQQYYIPPQNSGIAPQ